MDQATRIKYPAEKLEENKLFQVSRSSRQEDLPRFYRSRVGRPLSRVIGKPAEKHVETDGQIVISTTGHNALIFCIEGYLGVSGDRTYAPLPAGYMMLLPFGSEVNLYALKPSVFIDLHFSPDIVLCQGICPQHSMYEKESSQDKETMALENSKNTQKSLPPSFLPINKAIRLWYESVQIYAQTVSETSDVFDIKLRELFFLFRLTYDRGDLDMFLRYFHCRNTGFRAFVFDHHLSCKTTEDLANLMGLSLTSLKRAFREEFGTSPLKWMNERKAQFIQRDLTESDLDINEMAERYGFGSTSYFCSFTKRMLGQTPQAIRAKSQQILLENEMAL